MSSAPTPIPDRDRPPPEPSTVTAVPSDAAPSNTETLTPSPAPAPGASRSFPDVPGYEVLGELGRGGMGVVYQARHTQLNRLVALKVVLAGGHAGEQELRRFRTEAESVARLQHPNIVQIYEVGQHNGLPYIALEFCPGGSLAAQLGRAPLPPPETAEIVAALARAMHAAHQAGIVHRDLKPQNVLLAEDGTPKVTDFGLAKRLDVTSGQTATGAVLGTPSYMAPEQARGEKDIGPAADVYGLGAILYELLTGRPPFRADTPLATVQQVLSDEPEPPAHLRPKLSPDLEAVCLKCLRKAPDDRYPSALSLAKDLRRFLDGTPVVARKRVVSERVALWLRRAGPVQVLLGLAALYLLVAAAAAAGQGCYVAVPVLGTVLGLFLWPRAVVLAFGVPALVCFTVTGVVCEVVASRDPDLRPKGMPGEYVYGEDPPFSALAGWQWVIDHRPPITGWWVHGPWLYTMLKLTLGVLLGLTGLTCSRVMKSDRALTTLGALFGFALGFRIWAGLLLAQALPAPTTSAPWGTEKTSYLQKAWLIECVDVPLKGRTFEPKPYGPLQVPAYVPVELSGLAFMFGTIVPPAVLGAMLSYLLSGRRPAAGKQ